LADDIIEILLKVASNIITLTLTIGCMRIKIYGKRLELYK
jgi:hypothetical protein